MSPQRVEFVSKAEFYRKAGISRSRCETLVEAGLPLGKTGKVPLKRALAWVEANVDASRRSHWQGDGRPKTAPDRAQFSQKQADPPSLNDFRRQREAQKVEAGALELAKARGELVARVDVRKFLADRARMERDGWISWASAAAGRLASACGVDAGRLFGALEAEVRDHLRSLSERPLEGASALFGTSVVEADS